MPALSLSLSLIKKFMLASMVLPLCLGLTACNDDSNSSSSNGNTGNNNNNGSNGKTPVMDCAPNK